MTTWEFAGEVWEWRGPAPYHFVSVPEDLCDDVRDAADVVSYGWGMVPVTLRIGATTWTTSLWRRAEEIELGDVVSMVLHVDLST